jgi:starch synthase
MKVLMAASEVVGFAKTGGLADVAGSLPRALADLGHECAVFLPLYRCARNARVPPRPTEHAFTVPVGTRTVPARLWRSHLPDSGVAVYLVEQAEYFDRDDPAHGRGLYQHTFPDGHKGDYADNSSRFIFFCRAVLESLPLVGFWPDVLHANDWQTGLLPVYLREIYRKHGDDRLRDRYDAVRTLFTLHNLAYQGVFWHWDVVLTGLDWRLFNYRQLEFHGQVNFLKAGIVFADLINTVSPTYAREIQTPYFGAGLQGVLAERRDDLFGIVNGVDYAVWDPATDPHLAARYDERTVTEGKPLCKADLQRRFGLPERPDAFLLGVVARLVDQKGLDILVPAGPALMEAGVQLVVLGEGDRKYHEHLTELRRLHPRQVGLHLGFDEALAHQVEAGADAFLMPSLYEPSGLNQLYSMKYGTPPVVRATGGLADTVTDCTPEALAADRATGFRFIPYSADGLLVAVRRAHALYRDRPADWLRLARAGMRQDWSWRRSAREYEKLYERLQALPAGR